MSNDQPYASVKIKITREQLRNFRKKRRGLKFNWYAPIIDGVNYKNDPSIDWRDVTIFSFRNDIQTLHQRDARDINEELAEMDSKFRIIQDHLKYTDNHDLVELKDNKLIKQDVMLDHPQLDGENDKLRSKATDVHEIFISKQKKINIEKYFQSRKAFWNRTEFKNLKSHTHPETKEEGYLAEFGRIS